MTASVIASASGVSLPAPKLRLRSLPSGPVDLTLFDTNVVQIDREVGVVLAQLPDSAFDPALEVELRLFRYGRAKSRASKFPTPARWAALPHIEGGGNPYSASGWLGGTPASGATDRFSRVMLGGLSHGDVVDVTVLAANWLRIVTVAAYDGGGATISEKIVSSTWTPTRLAPSLSFGLSRNVEPARFAVGYVARNPDNQKWDLVSPLSKFMIANTVHPFRFDPDGAIYEPPSPAGPGRRCFYVTPGYDVSQISARISDSEWLAGR